MYTVRSQWNLNKYTSKVQETLVVSKYMKEREEVQETLLNPQCLTYRRTGKNSS